MAALTYNLWLGVSLGLCLCEPSIAVAVIQWLWFALSLACIRPNKKVKVVLLQFFWLTVALALSLVGPSMKATMLQWLWFCLGLAVAVALSPPSKKAAMVARLLQMLGYTATSKAAPWPELPPELLGLVLLRMTSRADRVRICAVCRSWRSGARLQPLPPLLPWVAQRDGTFLSLPDGAIHRTPAPDYDHVLYRVSTGSMLFLVDRDGGCFLVNPSSGKWGPPVNSLTFDIAIFHGKLYVLTRENYRLGVLHNAYGLPELHVLELEAVNMSIRSVQCIRSTHRDYDATDFVFYLVASGNRLLTVGRIFYPNPIGTPMPSRYFKVFQAAELSSGHGWWSKVDTLMGHALFLSRGCSRSLAVRGRSVSGGAQEDCMYFMSELGGVTFVEVDLLNSCVYNMRNQTVEHLPLETQALSRQTGGWFPTWLFPAEV